MSRKEKEGKKEGKEEATWFDFWGLLSVQN